MSEPGYAMGLLWLVVTVVPVLFGALRLRRRVMPDWAGAPARLAEAILALAILFAAAELLGLVGLLRAWPVAAVTGGAGAVVGLLAGRASGGGEGDGAEVVLSSVPRAGVLAAGTAGVVAAVWGSRVVHSLRGGMTNYDTLWYHLTHAARFDQVASITHLHFTNAEPVTTFLPANNELFHALGILPFHRDLLSPLLNLGWLALALLAAWCIGRTTGTAAVALVGVAVVAVTPVMALTQPGEGLNDIVGLALLLSAAAFVVNGRGRKGAVALAAIAGGLALGTKLTMIVPVLALAAGSVLISPRPTRWRVSATWVLMLVAFGGVWYVRNLVAVGNPVPGLHAGVGPFSLPSPPIPEIDRYGFSIAHYATDLHVWRTAFRPGFALAFGPAWYVVFALAGVGIVGAVLRGPTPAHRVVAAAGAVAAVTFVFTPATAFGIRPSSFFVAGNARYLTPALVLGLAVLPQLPALATATRQRLTLAALTVTLLVSQSVPDRLARLANQTPQIGLRLWPGGHERAAAAVLGAAALVALGVAVARRLHLSRRLLGVGMVAAVLTAAVAGWFGQHRYLDRRYAHFSAAAAWARHVHHARIAIAGSFLQYPLYGEDLTNWVQYVGRRGAHGAFFPTRSCEEWRRVVTRGSYDYVVTAPLLHAEPREAEWTRSDPSAREIVRVGSESVFRLEGTLDPTACR